MRWNAGFSTIFSKRPEKQKDLMLCGFPSQSQSEFAVIQAGLMSSIFTLRGVVLTDGSERGIPGKAGRLTS